MGIDFKLLPLLYQGGVRNASFTIETHQHDCLVIGAGGAGLRSAVGLVQEHFTVALVSKLFPTRSHTIAAQGGMNASIGTYLKAQMYTAVLFACRNKI